MAESGAEFPAADGIQVGKRRSSLGALNKTKPVSKFKAMFEGNGQASNGVTKSTSGGSFLARLKPTGGVAASHDPSTSAAFGSDYNLADVHPGSQTISIPAPQTPTAPLFSITAPLNQDGPGARSPMPSTEPASMSHYHGMDDGSEPDARSTKSPSSGSLFKRMGKGIKKILTPMGSKRRSEAGSMDGASPMAGSSTQHPHTPLSQPSYTSMDLNACSDQCPLPKSPAVAASQDVHTAQEEQEWSQSAVSPECSGEVQSALKAAQHSASQRPPLSPSPRPTPSRSSSILDSVGARLAGASATSASASASPSTSGALAAAAEGALAWLETAEHAQLQTPIAKSAGAAAPGSVSPPAAVAVTPAAAAPAAYEEHGSFDASLTASPAEGGSEGTQCSPPMREANMGADLTRLLQLPAPGSAAPSEGGAPPAEAPAAQDAKEDLVFPCLPAVVPASPEGEVAFAAAAASPTTPQACSPAPMDAPVAALAFALPEAFAAAGGAVDVDMADEPTLAAPGVQGSPAAFQGTSLAAAGNPEAVPAGSPCSPDAPGAGATPPSIMGLSPVRLDAALGPAEAMDAASWSPVHEHNSQMGFSAADSANQESAPALAASAAMEGVEAAGMPAGAAPCGEPSAAAEAVAADSTVAELPAAPAAVPEVEAYAEAAPGYSTAEAAPGYSTAEAAAEAAAGTEALASVSAAEAATAPAPDAALDMEMEDAGAVPEVLESATAAADGEEAAPCAQEEQVPVCADALSPRAVAPEAAASAEMDGAVHAAGDAPAAEAAISTEDVGAIAAAEDPTAASADALPLDVTCLAALDAQPLPAAEASEMPPSPSWAAPSSLALAADDEQQQVEEEPGFAAGDADVVAAAPAELAALPPIEASPLDAEEEAFAAALTPAFPEGAVGAMDIDMEDVEACELDPFDPDVTTQMTQQLGLALQRAAQLEQQLQQVAEERAAGAVEVAATAADVSAAEEAAAACCVAEQQAQQEDIEEAAATEAEPAAAAAPPAEAAMEDGKGQQQQHAELQLGSAVPEEAGGEVLPLGLPEAPAQEVAGSEEECASMQAEEVPAAVDVCVAATSSPAAATEAVEVVDEGVPPAGPASVEAAVEAADEVPAVEAEAASPAPADQQAEADAEMMDVDEQAQLAEACAEQLAASEEVPVVSSPPAEEDAAAAAECIEEQVDPMVVPADAAGAFAAEPAAHAAVTMPEAQVSAAAAASQELSVSTEEELPMPASPAGGLAPEPAVAEEYAAEAAPASPLPPSPRAADPMMISPMPAAVASTLLAARSPSPAVMVPTEGATPASAGRSASGTPGQHTPISPDTARLGVRAFPVMDFEDAEPAAEESASASEEVAEQAAAACVPDAEQPASSSPVTAECVQPTMELPASPPAAEPEQHEEPTPEALASSPVALEAPATDTAVPSAEAWLARLSINGKPNASPTVRSSVVGGFRGMRSSIVVGGRGDMDSLEAMEALMGEDDGLLAGGCEDGGLDLPMPQAASSPVGSAEKHPKFGEGEQEDSATKPTPSKRIQVERESIPLFSMRASAQTANPLDAESLDTFENLLGKSRMLPFVPMAAVNEGVENDADDTASVVGGAMGFGSPASVGPKGGSASAAASAATPVAPLDLSLKSLTGAAGAHGSHSAARPGKPGAAGPVRTPAGPAAKGAAAGGAHGAAVATPGTAGHGSRLTRPSPAPAPASKLKPNHPTAHTPAAASAHPTAAAKKPAAHGTHAHPTMSTPLTGAHGSKTGAAASTATKAHASTPTPSLNPAGAAASSWNKGQATPATPTLMPGSVAPRTAAAAAGGHVGAPGGTLMFDTPMVMRAAAMPLADSPFPSDFDLDTMDISAEATKAAAMLGGAQRAASMSSGGHMTPMASGSSSGGAPPAVAGTPGQQMLEVQVQMLTGRLAEAEAQVTALHNDKAMLEDQLRTLQFESSMNNEIDMEREARLFVEQELEGVKAHQESVESDLRAAQAEAKQYGQEVEALRAARAAQEAAWAKREAEFAAQMQQAKTALEAAQVVATQADSRALLAEQQAASAKAHMEEESARLKDLQATLGVQAHQIIQVSTAKDAAEIKFTKAMENLITAQTGHKKIVSEYEAKLQHQQATIQQYLEFRERYKAMKQQLADTEARAQQAEAQVQEAQAALGREQAEKAELMRMCNELLTELEVMKGKAAGLR